MLEILLVLILIWIILKSKKNNDEKIGNITYNGESFGYLKDGESLNEFTVY